MAGAVRNGNAAMSSSTSSVDDSTNGEIQYHTDGTSFQVVDTKTETHHTFNVGYNDDIIRTTVTPEASIVDEWIEDLYASIEEFPEEGLVVGLDIEWVRLQETSQRNKIDVLQLCFDKQCLIFQFFGCDKVSEKLGNFLSDSRIVFVGSGIDKDARKLFVDYDLFVARSEDLGPLADYKLGRKNLYKKNLKVLVEEVLGEKLPKYGAITLSRWDIGDKYDKGHLRKEQVMHACLDAYASFRVGMDLIHRPDPSKREFSYSNKDFKKLPQETNQGTKATNQGQGARDASSQGQGARDAS
ncbi:hypothetical protein MKW94_008543 [Papaver nudicaule]|uniref:3'-5' exonuclease domain-containing protein n=1 Tax=Papaver nudicaule TaxID=74823 RepID=A0AA41VXB8_PAPNU|nr:hypothetical protein [Papaver nudicaule]